MPRESKRGCKLVLGKYDEQGNLEQKIMVFKGNGVEEFTYCKYLKDALTWKGKLISVGMQLSNELKNPENVELIDKKLESLNTELSKIQL